jgi:hypothetical protein
VLKNGERQVATDISGIRRDHIARYEFARTLIKKPSRVLDVACGVGYGSWLLAQDGHTVIGADISPEAIDFAKKHWSCKGTNFVVADLTVDAFKGAEVAVCFETIEHLENPAPFLRGLRNAADLLIASVPNETVFPYENYKFHYQHYTRSQFTDLLLRSGWQPVAYYGQEGPESEVEPEIEGRTLIVVARKNTSSPKKITEDSPGPNTVESHTPPRHVVIIGLGPSASSYMDMIKTLGNRHKFADEVWAINAMADIIQHDRVFHMDDVLVQEQRAEKNSTGNIAAMLEWMKKHPGPIYTSVKRDGYPGLVEFPLAEVLSTGGLPYFNSTAAYAIAYALHIGVKEISLYGIDYTLPNAHSAEQGRACCEFWLGMAMARGVLVNVPAETSLMDGCEPDERKFYGFDMFHVNLEEREEGGVEVKLDPKENPPTAEEIEKRYNHNQHPNPLMRKK